MTPYLLGNDWPQPWYAAEKDEPLVSKSIELVLNRALSMCMWSTYIYTDMKT